MGLKNDCFAEYFRAVNILSKERVIYSFEGNKNEWKQILEFLGKLYTMGINIQWNKVMEVFPYHKVSLPTYNYDKKKCWFTVS